MGNESTALVHERGCVDLKFSSGKIILLFNAFHVPNIRKNLVSSSVLNNCGYKQVIESNKFVLSKHGVFIGFGYLSNQIFRINIVNDNIASAFMSTSKLNDSILWLDWAIDLCDLHATPSLGNKKYFVTFIDDASRVPNKRNMITPYELWTKRKPNLNYLRVWGCRAVVRLPDPKLKTLGERGIECIFVGYAEHSKAFRFYVIEPNDSVSINHPPNYPFITLIFLHQIATVYKKQRKLIAYIFCLPTYDPEPTTVT
ncbi:hypothetical protein Tco_0825220 [Tanacetum coccineum]